MYYFNVPGLRNSGPQHWQSLWEQQFPDQFQRIPQDNWAAPDGPTWIQGIQQHLADFPLEEVVLIGHSVGCAAIVQWYAKYQMPIAGALLVAPSDVDRPDYPSYITGFAPMPLAPLSFPSTVVASTNDHVVSLERARFFADAWGSDWHSIPNGGHLEDSAGLGHWPTGLQLLERFRQ